MNAPPAAAAASAAAASSSFFLPPPPPPPPLLASSASDPKPSVSYRPEELDQQKVTQALINYVENAHFPYINDFNNYERIVKIGQGTFGCVLLRLSRVLVLLFIG